MIAMRRKVWWTDQRDQPAVSVPEMPNVRRRVYEPEEAECIACRIGRASAAGSYFRCLSKNFETTWAVFNAEMRQGVPSVYRVGEVCLVREEKSARRLNIELAFASGKRTMFRTCAYDDEAWCFFFLVLATGFRQDAGLAKCSARHTTWRYKNERWQPSRVPGGNRLKGPWQGSAFYVMCLSKSSDDTPTRIADKASCCLVYCTPQKWISPSCMSSHFVREETLKNRQHSPKLDCPSTRIHKAGTSRRNAWVLALLQTFYSHWIRKVEMSCHDATPLAHLPTVSSNGIDVHQQCTIGIMYPSCIRISPCRNFVAITEISRHSCHWVCVTFWTRFLHFFDRFAFLLRWVRSRVRLELYQKRPIWGHLTADHSSLRFVVSRQPKVVWKRCQPSEDCKQASVLENSTKMGSFHQSHCSFVTTSDIRVTHFQPGVWCCWQIDHTCIHCWSNCDTTLHWREVDRVLSVVTVSILLVLLCRDVSTKALCRHIVEAFTTPRHCNATQMHRAKDGTGSVSRWSAFVNEPTKEFGWEVTLLAASRRAFPEKDSSIFWPMVRQTSVQKHSKLENLITGQMKLPAESVNAWTSRSLPTRSNCSMCCKGLAVKMWSHWKSQTVVWGCTVHYILYLNWKFIT